MPLMIGPEGATSRPSSDNQCATDRPGQAVFVHTKTLQLQVDFHMQCTTRIITTAAATNGTAAASTDIITATTSSTAAIHDSSLRLNRGRN